MPRLRVTRNSATGANAAGAAAAPSVPWTPAELTTAVWLDAADAATITLNGSSVSQWSDKSGNSYHATQSSFSSQPVYTAAGQAGKAILAFDGSNDFFNFASGISPRTIIAVAKTSVSGSYKTIAGAIATSGLSSQTDAYYFQFNNPANITAFGRATVTDSNTSTNLLSLAGTATTGEYFILAGKQEGQQITSWFNGVQGSVDTDASALKGVGNGVIGAGYYNRNVGDYWQGTIAEVIICANAQADQDIRRLEGYLAHKWGLTANLPSDHPYKNAAPTV